MAERTLVGMRAPRLLRFARSRAGVVVNYHNVVPDGQPAGGDRSLHISRSDFARQLDVLMETHEVTGLPSLIEAGGSDGSSPSAAITIDDGYRGALTVGLRELRSRGLPCTIFVPPALLGAEALWWDALAPEGPGGLPTPLREEALTLAGGRPEDVWSWAARRGLERRPQPPHAGLVGEDELGDVVRREGVTVGAHGWTHANLAVLGGKELEDELGRPLNWLKERFGAAFVPWLSLPYGRSTEQVVSTAVEAGYRGVLDISGRLLEAELRNQDRTVPRINIPAGLTVDGFRLRTAGL